MHDFAYMQCSIPAGVTLPVYRANRTNAIMSELADLTKRLTAIIADMSALGEQWLEARAGGMSTKTFDDQWNELERQRRRIERRIRRIEKIQRKSEERNGA